MVGIIDGLKNVLGGIKQDIQKRENEDNALALVSECYENKSAREPADRQAFINHAFINGRQWLQWNDTSKKFETDNKVPNWRVRLVVNKMLPIYLDRISKFLKNAPVTYVEPATQSEEDHALAKIGTGLIDHLYRITNNEEKNQDLVGQFLIAGVSYKHIFWNPNKGKVLGMYQYEKNEFPIMDGEKSFNDEKGNPLYKIVGEDGKPMGELRIGEVDTEILSLTEVIFPKGVKTHNECSWGMIVKVMNKDKIKEIYGKEVNEEDIPDEAIFNSKPVTVYGGTGGTSATSKPENSVMLKELYLRPYFDKKENKFYKKGRVITVANGVVLKDRENIIYDPEYNITEIPIIPYWDLKIPYMREGDTILRHLIPMQKGYNKCVDVFTEALTQNGWKKYNELLVGDIILSYNKEKDICEWQPMEDVFIKNYQGFLNVLENNQISSRTTDGHTFIVKHKVNGKTIVTKNPNGEHSIPLIKSVVNNNEDNLVYADSFLTLVGYTVTEGQYPKPKGEINKYTGEKRYSNKVTISQSKKKNLKKTKEIENCLVSLGEKYGKSLNKKSKVVSFNINSKLGQQIRNVAPNKIPAYFFINSLSLKQLRVLFNAIIAGDGTTRIAKNGKLRLNFYSSDLELAEMVQYVGILLGENPRLKRYEAKSEWHKKPFQYILTFKIDRHKEYASVQRARKESVYYSGIIWCPTIKNGFWLCRRDGKINITGNTRSQNIEIKNLINKPKWLKPRAGNITEEITSEPAQQIEYTYPYRPEVIAPQGIPHANYEELQLDSKDIEDVASWHDISRGNAPAQVRSGVALNYLLERDESPLSIPIRSFELQEEKAAQLMLIIADQKYKEERKIEVTGNNGTKQDVMFKAGGIGPNRHVVIKAGSAMPKSLFAKQQFILQLKNEGLLGNPNDPVTQKKILGLLQFGDIDSVYDNSILDERLANYENEETKKGATQQIQANPFDDHIIHINIHERVLKAIDVPAKIKQVMIEHWKQHQSMIPPQPMPVAKIGIDSKDMTKGQIKTALEISGVPTDQNSEGEPTVGEEELEKTSTADAIMQTQKLKMEQKGQSEDIWAKHRGLDIEAERLALDAQIAATEASKPVATPKGK